MLSLFLAGLASPVAAASEEEKGPAAPVLKLGTAPSGGAVGSIFRGLSGGTRARFGLGLETFFEHQESLRIAGMESAFTVGDLVLGGEESGILHGDPGLLNRKFDIVWEMQGDGVELPIALSRFGGSARSTLVLRAATADVTLDFLDRTRAQDSSSLGGRGSLFGAEVNVVSSLSPNSSWFTEASYEFQKIPRFTVERSPRFGPAGFEVPEDEVQLGRDVQEIAARIGYGFPGNRITAYTGVLHRRTDLEIEDDLRYLDPLRTTETRLSSHTELESEATFAVAGVDYQLGPRLQGRLETSVGEEDWGVAGRVVYRAQPTRPARPTRTREEIEAFAMSIAPLLEEIEGEFGECRKVLAVKGHPIADVARLLDWTETRLLEVINLEELDPIRASIQHRFRGFRKELGLAPPSAGEGPQTPCDRTGIALASYKPAQADPGGIPSESVIVQTLNDVGKFLLRATGLARPGNFTLDVCMDSVPQGAKYYLWSPGQRSGKRGITAGFVPEGLVRGTYFCEFRKPVKYKNEDLRFPCFDLWDANGNQRIKCSQKGCDKRPLQPPECP